MDKCRMLFLLLAFIACKKDHCSDQVESLKVAETETPASVKAGQSINARLSGSTPSYFRQRVSDISVTDQGNNHYYIQVKATYPGCQNVATPVFWSYDTIVSIPTTAAGTYILQFDAPDAPSYDTVEVVN